MRPSARRLLLPLLLVAALAGLAGSALGAGRNGVAPVTPKSGKQVQAGDAVTFGGRVSGGGSVWVRVCKSKKTGASGLICARGLQTRAKRTGRAWIVTPTVYDFPGYWGNVKGTWYWQAHRVSCDVSGRNCFKPGPIRSIEVQ